jgi:hypothetical protein
LQFQDFNEIRTAKTAVAMVLGFSQPINVNIISYLLESKNSVRFFQNLSNILPDFFGYMVAMLCHLRMVEIVTAQFS